MSQFKVFIWGINESRTKMEHLCAPLLKTARIFNINAEFIGIGHTFKEHKQRIEILQEFLKWEDPESKLLFLDGSDTLFNGTEEQIIQKFNDLNTEIVLSAEKSYSYQYTHYRDKYDSLDSDYKYVNAGTFMGTARSLKKMVDEFAPLMEQYPTANDQTLMGIWAYKNFENNGLVKLDTDCSIFWVTTGDWKLLEETAKAHNYILHPSKNQRPAVIHCPGIGFEPNKKSYLAAFQTVTSSTSKPFQQIAVIAPLESEYYYNIDPASKHKEGRKVPSWFCQRHPHIAVFFYGKKEKQEEEDLIPTAYLFEAIQWLENKYHVDCIVHIPPDKFINFDHLNNVLQETRFKDSEGLDYPIQESFIYHNNLFYSAEVIIDLPYDSFHKNWEYSKELQNKARSRRVHGYSANTRNTEVISLGGWSGPGIALNHLTLRKNSYPFDMVHSTAECVLDIMKGQAHQFLKIDKKIPTHHHNLQDKETNVSFQNKIENLLARLKDPTPILFVRAIISNDYKKEINVMTEMIFYVNNELQRNDQLLLILHDQHIGTVKIRMHAYNIMMWSVHGNLGGNVSDCDLIYRNFERAIEYALDQKNWTYDAFQIRSHAILNHKTKEFCNSLYEV